MKIAVVILNWNGKALLEQFLPSIIRNSPQADIYVADNASTDESVFWVKSHFPNVKIIQNKKNFGFAGGYNEALKDIVADVFALVNSDIEATPNWLLPINNIFENQPETAIIQPKILDYKNQKYFEYAGAAGGFIDKYGFPYCRGRIFESIEMDHNQYHDQPIFWASGACFFIRRSVFLQLVGFDADFFAHQEEIDLCWRAYNRGHKVMFASESVVYHVGGATLEKGNPKKTFLNFRNSLFMMTKNLPKNQLFPVLYIRLSLDGIAAIRFLIKGKPLETFAVLKSHFWFYYYFIRNYKKRDTHQKRAYFQTKSIVYNYFIKNGKVFD